MMSIKRVYFGAIRCPSKYKNGKECRNMAYYLVKNDQTYKCGLHSRKLDRMELPRDPDAEKHKQEAIAKHDATVDKATRENYERGSKGKVVCSKLKMFKGFEQLEGYLNVYPNNKHQNKSGGFGCASLSPMQLGPVEHGQSGLPIAKNIENFHQGNKCFPSEVDKDGNPLPIFYQTQKTMYEDLVPHRHKTTAVAIKGKSKNIPVYSIWVTKDGKEKRCTYIESRQYYCRFYEQLAPQTEDYKKLVVMLKNGTNLNIIGYDGYPVTKSLQEHYLDPSRPFGHELVLYTLLTSDPKDYPWYK